MKSPLGLGKLRRFGFSNSSNHKEKGDSHNSFAQLDELALATQDMQQMRECYDSLLSTAAVTENCAYEFSVALQDFGSCLLDKTALHDDKASGEVFSMLGQVQFELQKLFDSYRSHVLLTITNPSESLLNELCTVEEMKRQCDEKRNVYEYMTADQKEKGRSKGGKGESYTLEQLKAAHDEYNDQATLCVFRLKSLKQGQPRSLLTQAARHHAAQLNFFRKGLKSLEAIDQQVRLVTEQLHIDYQISGLDDVEDCDNSYDGNDGRELSFDYTLHGQGSEFLTSRNSMEVDQVGPSPTAEHLEMHMEKDQDLPIFDREHRVISHSAPIFPEKKYDLAEKAKQMHPPSAKTSSTYVLPTPIDVKSSVNSRTSISDPHIGSTNHGACTHKLWHSSPLEQKRNGKVCEDDSVPGPGVAKAQAVLNERKNHNNSSPLPQPLVERPSIPNQDMSSVSNITKVRRHAFSGPFANKSSSIKPEASASGLPSTSESQLVSKTAYGVAGRHSSPRVSPSASPPLSSPPRISELHELPRPPGSLAAKSAKSSKIVGHSAPLGFRKKEIFATNKISSAAPSTASPLPTPKIVSRSFSIPSSRHRAMALHVSKLLEVPQVLGKTQEISSPLLTPIALSIIKPTAAISEIGSDAGQIEGQR